MTWTAYVDESIRAPLGVYVLAAAVLDAGETRPARGRVSELSQRGLPFHWRLERADRRSAAVDFVAGLPALHVVVIGAKLNQARQERGRRHCLGELLYRLEDAGVSGVQLESRGRIGDRRDVDAVDAFRTQQRISGGIRVDHVHSTVEPLVWLPDIVAGAVSEAESGGTTRYRDRLSGVLTEHRIMLQ